ncbi:unnamed protein product [Merluccius merluccius]
MAKSAVKWPTEELQLVAKSPSNQNMGIAPVHRTRPGQDRTRSQNRTRRTGPDQKPEPDQKDRTGPEDRPGPEDKTGSTIDPRRQLSWSVTSPAIQEVTASPVE